MNSKRVVIVGGGIVGLATAWRLTERFPGARVCVLEKEAGGGRPQTGPQQRLAALRPVLQTGIGEGAPGRHGHPPDGGVLPREWRSARDLRQAGGRRG